MWVADKRHGQGQLQSFVQFDGKESSATQVQNGFWENDVFVGDRFVAWVPPPSTEEAAAVTSANGAGVAKRTTKRVIPCRNWTATGTCTYGDGCHFKDGHFKDGHAH
jgi:hypothetical protein